MVDVQTAAKSRKGAKPTARKPRKSAAEPSMRRTLVTPEGVDLGVEIAPVGARAGAFILDALILAAGLTVLTLAAGFSLRKESEQVIEIIWLLGFFLLRNFWFMGWEMQARGATPGKRIMKIRVAMRNGGRLTADAVFARNAVRELEVFLPLTLLVAGAFEFGPWGWVAGVVWSFIFLLFPLFNRDKLRVGDLIAGTWVVQAPRVRLAPDLAAQSHERLARYNFSPAQLDAYGVMELQVLEDVLRRLERKTMNAVASRIRHKIGWVAGADESDYDFLNAYYAAVRKHLEQKLLFGKRKKDKHDRS
jgi:uncharacterized RDD family membrane protein YckC